MSYKIIKSRGIVSKFSTSRDVVLADGFESMAEARDFLLESHGVIGNESGYFFEIDPDGNDAADLAIFAGMDCIIYAIETE